MTAKWWQCTNPEQLRGRCKFERRPDDDYIPLDRVIEGKPVLRIDKVPTELKTDPRTGHCMRMGRPHGAALYLHVFAETPPPIGDWEPVPDHVLEEGYQ
ncbi:hypothetical protein [Rhodococcus koreensis]